MRVNHLVYQLNDGYIHNWLVAGPQIKPVQDPDGLKADETSYQNQIPRTFDPRDAILAEAPIDSGSFEIDGDKLTWDYTRCREDHFIDVSNANPAWQHLRTWAYVQLNAPNPFEVKLVLTTSGLADIWLNGNHIHRQETYPPGLISTQIQASLEHENELLICFEQVAVRECVNVMALQIVYEPSGDDDKEITVHIPTKARYPLRHQNLEQIFEKAYLEEVVNHRGAHFNLRWAEDLKETITYAYKITDTRKYVYVEGTWRTDPTKPVDVGHNFRLKERPYFVSLTAPLKEYFEHNLRYTRNLPIHVLDDAYSSTPYKNIAQRRLEALKSATKYESNLFAEIAKMELGQWSDLNPRLIMESVDQVNRRNNDSDILLIGLLGIAFRYMDNPSFPEVTRPLIEDCIRNFKYWHNEPGKDALNFPSESHAILFHTCEILAGQRYPERDFPSAGKSGRWHRKTGEQLAIEWMQKRGTCGFMEWDSNYSFDQVILALSYLTSLAKNDTVRELAAVLLDKILFTIAVNSFKGVFGSSHGYTHASMIKSAQLEATSGITRLLWGMGVFNHHILGTVSLACSNYEYPAFIADIATELPDEMWHKERYLYQALTGEAVPPAIAEVNTVTYKTPDYMLSSAQDYRPGESGCQEHIWQATMGPDAMVFTSHPSCMSENEAHLPGFWLGNVVLPRIAQWKDVLIAVYNFSEHDWMGFTHAFFPVYAFDEHNFSQGWAFARKGKGYLALTSARGFELNKRGPDGYRELRSYGCKNVWICQMGREALDGTFDDFQHKITRLPLAFKDLAVNMTSLRGEDLSFSWQDTFRINQAEQSITGFKHMEDPYCKVDLPAKQMDINYRDFTVRLNFT
jgi:hypothetical protein